MRKLKIVFSLIFIATGIFMLVEEVFQVI